MGKQILDWINWAVGIGIEPKGLTWEQVSLRGIVIFIATLLMVRLADKRFMGKKTAFDFILGLILASMLARGINGSAPLFPTLVCGFVLVGLHRALAAIAFRSHRFGQLVKGTDDILVEDGQVRWAKMRSNAVTERDLLESCRIQGKVESVAQVKSARMERNGDISIIERKP
jgi:uncharacterized membrane protein YcaP (DUF421 family)